MSMMERAARALAADLHRSSYESGMSGHSPSEYAELYWRGYRAEVATVLRALRQITPAEIAIPERPRSGGPLDWDLEDKQLIVFWQSVIDNILKQMD